MMGCKQSAPSCAGKVLPWAAAAFSCPKRPPWCQSREQAAKALGSRAAAPRPRVLFPWAGEAAPRQGLSLCKEWPRGMQSRVLGSKAQQLWACGEVTVAGGVASGGSDLPRVSSVLYLVVTYRLSS